MRISINIKKIFVLLNIFLISIGLRLWNLNEMGRTWDEFLYMDHGYRMIKFLGNGDFDNKFFYESYDHPPLVKYFYGITAQLDSIGERRDGTPIFKYDYTYSRILSAIVASLSIVLVVLIGWHIASFFVGMTAGIILAMLPFFLGISQLVTAESFIMLIFTASFYSFLLLLEKFSAKRILVTGILTGIALQVKQSNALVIPLYLAMYLVWYKFNTKKLNLKFLDKELFSIFVIFAISLIVFVLIWPTIIFHFSEVYTIHKSLWNVQFSSKIWQVTLSPPEVFFGRLILTPIFYYVVYFFITVPILILVFFFAGFKKIMDNKNWTLGMLVVWFFVPFIMSLYSWRQHGLRYIIEIYAPIALISAIGLETIVSRFTRKEIYKYLLLIPLSVYLLFVLYKISPYYLDYFNQLVGGVNGVYYNKSFQIGWWGQGLREAGLYIEKNAKKGSRVGLASSPSHVFPSILGLEISKYNSKKEYDFVVVNFYNILRDGFDDSEIRKKYKPVYYVKADEAILVTVYKK